METIGKGLISWGLLGGLIGGLISIVNGEWLQLAVVIVSAFVMVLVGALLGGGT